MASDNLYLRRKLPCEETPDNCSFELKEYREGEVLMCEKKNSNYIFFCQKGEINLSGSLFRNEVLHEGEILFLPRMADCRGEIIKDARMIIHSFNNTVCRPEECILSYLYTHKKQNEKQRMYHCKLSAHEVIITFMKSVCHYLTDHTGDLPLWHLKHKELIRLFSRYYKAEELQAFFHPMTDESIPFKNLVLSHYQKANSTQGLADLCGYGVITFRRIFKEEFGVSVYHWLIEKRSEHILYRLSFPYIPFRDIMEEFNFSSPQQFNRFCKTYLGDSPTNLRNKYKKE